MDVHITQFNVQLYFRKPVLDTDRLGNAFNESDGFSASSVSGGGQHPMQGAASFFRQGFRIAPVQSNALPFRILQVMTYPNAVKEPDSETLACLQYVTGALREHLELDLESE